MPESDSENSEDFEEDDVNLHPINSSTSCGSNSNSNSNSNTTVTLPQEEVLRLTTLSGSFNERLNNNNMNTNMNNNNTNHTNNINHSTSEFDPSSITLRTSHVLSLTTTETDDLQQQQQQRPNTSPSPSPKSGKKKGNKFTTPKKSSSSSSSSKDYPNSSSNNSSSSSKEHPNRSSSNSSSGNNKDHPNSSNNSSSGNNSSSNNNSNNKEREKPRRTKSGGGLKKAVKKEKKSVDAVVAAAIRNYGKGEDENNNGSCSVSPRSSSRKTSSRTTPKRSKSGSGKKKKSSCSSDGDETTSSTSGVAGSVTNTKKKTRRKRKPSGDLHHQHQQQQQGLLLSTRGDTFGDEEEEFSVDATSLDNYDEESALSPTLLHEAVSSSSFASYASSVDRAGAIAVFPSESAHATQRRSITDHRMISDNDTIIEATTTSKNSNNNRNLFSYSNDHLLDSSNRTYYDEVPEPPKSQVINATATAIYRESGPQSPQQQQQHPQQQHHHQQFHHDMPPIPTPAMSTTTSGQMTMRTTTTTSTSMSMSLDSSTDDGFLGTGTSLQRDAESGTVTANAISSEDYYAEVRRELQQEAVVAVDVIPLTEDGRPIDCVGSNNRYSSIIRKKKSKNNGNGNSSKPCESDQDRKRGFSHQSIRRKHVWICCGIGIILIVLIAILLPLMRRPGPLGVPTPTIAPWALPKDLNDNGEDEVDMDEIKAIMNSEEGVFWRGKILNVLPKEALVNILVDPNYACPQYTSFIFLVENAEALFDKPAEEESLSDLDASRVCTIFTLVNMYHSLGGENWFVKNNWLKPEVDICEWHGVNCKNDLIPKKYPTVGDASISSNPFPINLEDLDTIPPGDLDDYVVNELGNDDSVVDDDVGFDVLLPIHSLDLKANGLVGSLPEEIGLLKNIYGTIDLSINTLIVGTIPSSLGNLSKLKGMLLHSNNLESSLPTELGRMTSLRRFDISDNKNITGRLPNELELWTKIEELQIQGTGITGIVPSEFCDMIDNRAYEDEFLFKASCPDSLRCSCCTEC